MRIKYTLTLSFAAIMVGGTTTISQLRRRKSECPELSGHADPSISRTVDLLLNKGGLSDEMHDQICGRIRSINTKFNENDPKLWKAIELLQSQLTPLYKDYFLKKVNGLCPKQPVYQFIVNSDLIGFDFDTLNERERANICPTITKAIKHTRYHLIVPDLRESIEEHREFDELKIRAKERHPCYITDRFYLMVDGWDDDARLQYEWYYYYNEFEKSLLCEIWDMYQVKPNEAETYIRWLSHAFIERKYSEALGAYKVQFNEIFSRCQLDVESTYQSFRSSLKQETMHELLEIAKSNDLSTEEVSELCRLAEQGIATTRHDLDRLVTRIKMRTNEWPTGWRSGIEKKCAENGVALLIRNDDDHKWFEEYFWEMKNQQDIADMCSLFAKYMDEYYVVEDDGTRAADKYEMEIKNFYGDVAKRNAKETANMAAAAAPPVQTPFAPIDASRKSIRRESPPPSPRSSPHNPPAPRATIQSSNSVEWSESNIWTLNLIDRCPSQHFAGRSMMDYDLLHELEIVGKLGLETYDEYCRIVGQYLTGELNAAQAKAEINRLGYSHGWGMKFRLGKMYRGTMKRLGVM